MQRHSLFFQGNDAELGILAYAMGYNIGHIPFDVPTTVPDRVKPWWRQRYAWVGGEFRIYFVNMQFALQHWYFYIYGALVVTLLSNRWGLDQESIARVLAAVYAGWPAPLERTGRPTGG